MPPDFVPIEQHPAYRMTVDPNRVQEAADAIAYDHFRLATPEYIEWFREHEAEYAADLAIMVSNIVTGDIADKIEALRVAAKICEDWTQFVANASDMSCWALERQMHREVLRRVG